MKKPKSECCPNCGAIEEYLDWWIDSKGIWHWNCFECEHEWQISQREVKEEK